MSSRTFRVLVALAVTTAFGSASAGDFGRTTGLFAVSPSGAATYSIPIWTPPGPNGVSPSLSLSYNSQEGNGLVGLGWNLNAVSSIERCARTVGQDAAAAAIELNSNDRFCIDGKRLRLSSGTYGGANAVYFTELVDYARIKSLSYSGGGEYFIVEAKDGLRYEYGNSTTSRVDVGGATLRWMLSKVYDRNDSVSPNNYVITYLTSSGFAVPDSIFWTPASLGSTSYKYEAKFNYFNSRANSDSYIGHVAGYAILNRNRLESIQIKSAGTVVRRYRLDYNLGATSRSLLTSVKECADNLEQNCLLPITFNYQAGFSGVATGYAVPPAGSSNGIQMGRYDFNGDGKDDLLYQNGGAWVVATGADSGFGGPFNTSISGAVLVGRFLPNGRDGIATIVGGNLWIYRWDDGSAAFVGYNTGIASVLPKAAVDYSGDGLADLIYQPGGATITFRRNNSSGSTNSSFETSTTSVTLGGATTWGQVWSYNNNGLQRADVNGDGRQDAYAIVVQPIYNGQGQQIGAQPYAAGLLGAGTTMNLTPQATWVAGGNPVWPSLKFNDDQCTDRQIGSTILVAQCNGIGSSSVAVPASPQLLLDWDGDGRTDILVDNGGTFGVYLSTGSGFSSLIATTIPSAGTFFAMDQDGDGLEDLVKVNGTAAIGYWTHTSGYVGNDFLTNLPDVLMSVADGFGVTQSISYGSTSQSVFYGSGSATAYPLVQEPARTIVARVSSSDGIGGLFHKSYYYSGARQNWVRKEFAGFQRIDQTDSRTGLISRTYFDQLFPIAGTVSQTELMQSNGTTPISRQVFVNTSTPLDTAANNERHFVYTQASTATQYEVGGIWNGSLLRTVLTENSFDNTSGVVYDVKVTTTESASGANGVSAGGQWVTRLELPVADLVNHTGDWCLGRPQKIVETRSHNLTEYSTAITRTTSLLWNTSYCRPTKTVIEPDDTQLKVTTDIGYDGFGNVNSVTMAGSGAVTRTTSTTYTDGTYTTGQFPLSVTTAESASFASTSNLTWDYNLGVPLSSTDPNGISTGWLYDAFGRVSREEHADGTYVTRTVNSCATGCSTLGRYWIDTRQWTEGDVEFARTAEYFDSFDRQLESDQKRPDGYWNYHVRTFDAHGNVVKQYAPYTSAAGASIDTTYDVLDRPVSMTRRISDTNSSLQTSTVSYEGFTTVITDAQAKKTTRIADASGQLRSVIDDDGYALTFHLDAFGNPKEVKGAGLTLQTSVYNARGMLTDRTDMDMGTWKYEPNAFGEVLKVRDAKTSSPNWTQTYTFDALGRMTSRVEAEGTSNWTWGVLADNTAGGKYVGRLKSVSGPGYSEDYVYDSLGRPSSTRISTGTSYEVGYAYNDLGALETLTYPASTGSNPLKIRYEYDYGVLKHIKDCANPACSMLGTTYWTANSFNARGQITEEALGNNLVSTRMFDSVTGWLKSIKTGPGSTASIQDLEYEWDLVGNLKKRKDLNQAGLYEAFTYDDLYRLTEATLSTGPSLNFGYDALGNITSKSGVGTYSYHDTKKHQVTSTSNGWTFGYDANGNMNSGLGTSSSWTSYNLPASIASTTNYSNFSYTPDRQYWKQASNYSSGGAATTIYVGGLFEKVTTSAGTDYRHMIRAGGSTIIVSRPTSGANSVYYVTSDHIGSSSAITNSSGGILVNSSFGPFGARRGSNWTATPSAGDWSAIASTTRRGFTEHTMLDNMNFIHMNGRVYDQLLGRFVSADPLISDPANTQSFNRYSYVYNNPLSFTDPSGFVPCDTFKECQAYWANLRTRIITACVTYGCNYLSQQLGLGSLTAMSEADKHRLPPSGAQTVPTDAHGAWTGNTRLADVGEDPFPKTWFESLLPKGGLRAAVPQDGWTAGAARINGTYRSDNPVTQLMNEQQGQMWKTRTYALAAAGNNYYPEVIKNAVLAGAAEFAGVLRGLVASSARAIQTPYRLEVQASSSEALSALGQAQSGARLYRSGTIGSSMAGESQYWSLMNPGSPSYAGLMGVPAGTPNFVLSGVLRPGASVITNEAAALGANAGRGIQVVTRPGGVENLIFTMP
jgi:RHS repeat-associated protein